MAERDQANSAALTGIGLAAVWLLIAAVLVDVEYYDGLSAICNARYFLAKSSFYFFDRGPMMAWLLMPAETLKGWISLHPLDVRLHHGTSMLLHVGYLAAVYRMLAGRLGPAWSTTAAFTSAILSFMFASYAPFLSHDLVPGAILLWMVLQSHEFARAPRLPSWILLVVAGTIGPLIKQTYGVFWIAVLAAHFVPTLLRSDPSYRTSRRALAWLVGGAATSALLTWIVYAIVLENWIPQASFWVRPYRNLQYLGSVYEGTGVTFPAWIYVRNLWAYGRLTTLLLIPGVVLSWGGSPLQRRVALTWCAAVVFIQMMPLREVRYIACLAPLAAFIVVPAAGMLARSRVGRFAVAALLIYDVGGAAIEAFRIFAPFYRRSELRALLEPLERGSPAQPPIFHNISMLSFVAPRQSPLAADRYHHIFHAGVNQIGVLYGYAPEQVRVVLPPQTAGVFARAPDGSALLFGNDILAHGPAWVPGPPVGIESFFQGLAKLQTVVFRRAPDGAYESSDGSRITVNVRRESSGTTAVIGTEGLKGIDRAYLPPIAILGGREVHALQQGPDRTLLLTGLDRSSTGLTDPLFIRMFVIQRLSRPMLPVARR